MVNNWSGAHGADAVLFTAATSSSDPLSESFQMVKKKGRVVLVGVSGMEIKREDIYPKELDFLISTSYGPGRYDRNYEEKGKDYPYAYVRWTENRNMTEYLRLIHNGSIKLDSLIDAIYPI
jgi:threonine dehydrogenase-like Zn-dependent dehydrogenase